MVDLCFVEFPNVLTDLCFVELVEGGAEKAGEGAGQPRPGFVHVNHARQKPEFWYNGKCIVDYLFYINGYIGI